MEGRWGWGTGSVGALRVSGGRKHRDRAQARGTRERTKPRDPLGKLNETCPKRAGHQEASKVFEKGSVQ